MIMKALVYQVTIALAVGCAYAQTATQSMPQWKATVKVVDEAGQPVEGATVTIGYYIPPPASRPTSIATDAKRGVTDTNGLFTASEYSRSPDLFVGVIKGGYYKTHVDYELGPEYKAAKWSPELTLVLKRIGKPIPMYAKWVNVGMPVLDKPIGFDLMAGDWIAPYGKGASTEIIFTAHRDQRSEDDFDYRLTISFPKPGDGIQPFNPNAFRPGEGSALRSSHEAAENGYEPRWIKTQSQRPGEPARYGLDENLNFFFRVRTVLDEQGNVKSALYGKIYGDFMHFRYYLNPTANDRNVEFDPKHNLLKGLRGSQMVDAP